MSNLKSDSPSATDNQASFHAPRGMTPPPLCGPEQPASPRPPLCGPEHPASFHAPRGMTPPPLCGPETSLFPDLDFPPDPRLVAAGWQRRFTADAFRVKEARQLYSELGFEVHLEPINPAELGEACGDCRIATCLAYVTVYTRKLADSQTRKLADSQTRKLADSQTRKLADSQTQ